MSDEDLKLFEAKLKEHLRDPRVIYAYHGESMQSYKTGYFCGVADALEEMKPKCSEEVRQAVDDVEEQPNHSNEDAVLREECNKLFQDYEGCKQSLIKKCKECDALKSENEALQKKNTNLQRAFARVTSECDTYHDKYNEIKSLNLQLEERRSDLGYEALDWQQKYADLEFSYRSLLNLLINELSSAYVDPISNSLHHIKHVMDEQGWTKDPMEDLDL